MTDYFVAVSEGQHLANATCRLHIEQSPLPRCQGERCTTGRADVRPTTYGATPPRTSSSRSCLRTSVSNTTMPRLGMMTTDPRARVAAPCAGVRPKPIMVASMFSETTRDGGN